MIGTIAISLVVSILLAYWLALNESRIRRVFRLFDYHTSLRSAIKAARASHPYPTEVLCQFYCAEDWERERQELLDDDPDDPGLRRFIATH